MDYIGTIPIALWEEARKIAKETDYPEQQPPACPYILLKSTQDNQRIVLSGYFSKQAIDLFIASLREPRTPSKDYTPPKTADIDTAHIKANELLSRAIQSDPRASSIINQTTANE